jgi:hypothetical protein
VDTCREKRRRGNPRRRPARHGGPCRRFPPPLQRRRPPEGPVLLPLQAEQEPARTDRLSPRGSPQGGRQGQGESHGPPLFGGTRVPGNLLRSWFGLPRLHRKRGLVPHRRPHPGRRGEGARRSRRHSPLHRRAATGSRPLVAVSALRRRNRPGTERRYRGPEGKRRARQARRVPGALDRGPPAAAPAGDRQDPLVPQPGPRRPLAGGGRNRPPRVRGTPVGDHPRPVRRFLRRRRGAGRG